jgi:hypothetical protein
MEQELEQGSEVHTAQPVISRRNRLFRYHAATTGVILLVAVILHSKHAEKGCTSELNDGQWVEEGVWHTNNCTLHHFQTSEMEACVSQFSHVIAIGAEKWADAANLLCPITRAKGKKDSVGVQETTNAHSCTQVNLYHIQFLVSIDVKYMYMYAMHVPHNVHVHVHLCISLAFFSLKPGVY